MNKDRILGLLLAVVAVAMIFYGIADPGVIDEFKIYWMASAATLLPGLLLLAKKPVAATHLSRIVVGAVFIVSGLIKANDTVGFSIKLEEYFDENALGAFWATFHDFARPIAIFISGIEVLLGLAVVFGAKARLVSIVLLGMTIFFGWLTYYTAGCNAAQMEAIAAGEPFNRVCVTDCGCFGDALRGSVGRPLTPWESFYKDLGLFFLTLVIVFKSGSIKVTRKMDDVVILPAALIVILLFGGWLFGWMFPTWFFIFSAAIYFILKIFRLKHSSYEWVLALVFAAITYGFATYTYRHLPIKDYRPYAVGENIKDQMKSAEELGLQPTEYANMYGLKNEKTGEEMRMNSNEYLEKEFWKNKDWKIDYTSPEPVVITRGYEAPITTFSISNQDDREMGEAILNNKDYSFMVVAYDVEKAKEGKSLDKLNALAEKASSNGYHFFAVTSSSYDAYEEFRHANQLKFPFYTADEIFLKTIIRSNPGLMMLKNGEILGKWHANDIPTFATVQKEIINQ